ncbi:dicarboxylate/amino acid:cation symporter [Natrinema pallidum]|uniref:Sodium:dicarboxylate symporter n=2 Tax=Natrinema pallidum TaxID=69527 RepID=L9Z559_9EURY|nr:dicarboxylate/amino acid:cation symporter [Natrinema pallidum]ELY81499.1 sodium:dicarboxylate symporter [Natrinema pallidum DSM 3751]QCW02107.1 dicarboxylate/amino acid:cation symporter [Natrinema pallidum]
MSILKQYRSVPIVYRIAVAFVLGALVGLVVGQPATSLQPVGDLFVRLLEMIIVPIIIFTLLMATRELSPKNLGKVGGQVVVLYLATTAVAIAMGLGVSNLIDPGTGITVKQTDVQTEQTPSLVDQIFSIVPENPFAAIAEGNILAIIFFTLIFGLGMTMVRAEAEPDSAVRNGIETIFDIVDAGAEVMFKIVWGIMEFGVIGVFALMAALFGDVGVKAIRAYFTLSLTLAVAIALQITLVYLLLLIRGAVGASPVAFLRGIKEALITALSIRSSTATLPITMSDADENLRIEERVYGFSLPLGATINMDGTSMYLGIVAVFAANMAGVSLTLAEQFAILLTALLASIGTAGVPSASLVMMTAVLTQVGLPLEVIGMIAGIDPLLDRLRTMNNIAGDLAVTTVVAKWNDAIDLTGGVWTDGSVGLTQESVSTTDD